MFWYFAKSDRAQGGATYLRLGLSVPDNRHDVREGGCWSDERCPGGSNGLGLDSGRTYVGVNSGEVECVLVGRVGWMGVGGNGKDI